MFSGKKAFIIFLLITVLLQGCGNTKSYYTLPAKVSNSTFNAVIEIPAGTNKKYEYDPIRRKFIIDVVNGEERVIDFLPYPGNYGFIPSTLSKIDTGGDGDALDILVVSESLSVGTVLEVLPIAILKLIDDGEKDYKIIAVPYDKSKRILEAANYDALVSGYPKLIEIIGLWFLNYNPNDTSSIAGWGDETAALKEIEAHLKH